MNNKTYIFNTRGEAEDTLSKIKEIAEDYSMISLADVNYLCGLVSPYTDNKLGWVKATIDNACVTRELSYWSIVLPRPVPITEEEPKVSYREYRAKKSITETTPESTPEPLYITIHTNDVDSVDEILADTFKYIYTIKDRVVNLTIM